MLFDILDVKLFSVSEQYIYVEICWVSLNFTYVKKNTALIHTYE